MKALFAWPLRRSRGGLVWFIAGILSAPIGLLAAPPRLLQNPTISAESIAFSYGDDIWIVPRAGGIARRLATAEGRLDRPYFSPDGRWVAFTGNIEGNTDVYVVPSIGGEMRRLTWHPDIDATVGWTPDSRNVLFLSNRRTYRDLPQLYTVPVGGGPVAELPLPSGAEASYSPDGRRLAYVPYFQWEPDWKGYRGGQTTPIWIANLSDSSITVVPRGRYSYHCPMWIGNTIYFLSDRDGRRALFACDADGSRVRKVRLNTGFDIKAASSGAGVIVYDQVDALHVYDPATGGDAVVPVRIVDDLPRRRAHFQRIGPRDILDYGISPTGKRALFEVHGQILCVPAKKGDARDLTQSPGIANRSPAWSPDGKWIAYFSDRGGEYALEIRSPSGLDRPRRIDLGENAFFYAPRWSPDSRFIAYEDNRMNLWYVPAKGGAPVKVDRTPYETDPEALNPAWSPDSRWIAYVKELPNHLGGIFVYGLATKASHPVTDGLSDAGSPQFDGSGKYLYFTASTDTALSGDSGMWRDERPTMASVYAAVLRKDLPSPVAPESDEEGGKDASDAAKDKGASYGVALAEPPVPPANPAAAKAAPAKAAAPAKKAAAAEAKPKVKPVEIDFDGLDQRIVALPVPEAHYVGLASRKDGVLFLGAVPPVRIVSTDERGPMPVTLSRFDLKDRKVETIAEDLEGAALSFDGEKLLYEKDRAWFLTDANHPVKPGDGALKVNTLEVWVDPSAEWRQIYAEAWRIERDFFYDPHYHGLDLAADQKLYAAFLPGIASREDLNVLLREMTGWMDVGHMFIGGGEPPPDNPIATGLLGADYTVENGRFRIARIYSGENWNPDLRAPLTQPGVHAKVGEYVIAVNGREVKATDEFYRYFEQTAGRQTAVLLSATPDGKNGHEETVVPVASELNLRYRAWIEDNRRKVDELSGGKLGYLNLPDTAAGGYVNFNRYYFAQVDKQGVVVDERFNHGGQIADYIIDLLRRPVRMLAETRWGKVTTVPELTIRGPLVMIINQMSGSGGDALPWLFREERLGPLVGTRTWGGLIGIGGYPPFVDGGYITAPRWALFDTHGHWNVENRGVPPDFEVQEDPKLVREGHDPQLEKAVQVALAMLAKNPPKPFPIPPYPNHHQVLPPGP